MSESKKEIYDIIPQKYYPKTILIKESTAFSEVLRRVGESQLDFPVIAKPDIGLRGSAVKKITGQHELAAYHQKADFDFLIQELIPYENEVGIFYVRFPGQEKGRITGIVAKEFLIVTGDGVSSIEQLLHNDPRHEIQLKAINKEYGRKLNGIPEKGERINLVPYGNHARGAKFLDHSHKTSVALLETIDSICRQIPGFYFGRLDIMYNNFEELENRKNFMIVEINGTSSEPTHIYDPKHSIFFAWKELARHIGYMYKIGEINHKNGTAYLDYKHGMEQYRIHLEQSKKIVNF